mmetsp:Transcript_33274/g.53967  ORF Transcript_33274/g.53967 Transcript_33274/m.53967 type:complete len:162 (-) Transcript_33274:85-570(-)
MKARRNEQLAFLYRCFDASKENRLFIGKANLEAVAHMFSHPEGRGSLHESEDRDNVASQDEFVQAIARSSKDLTDAEFDVAISENFGTTFDEMQDRYVQRAVAYAMDLLIKQRPEDPVSSLAHALLEFESQRTGQQLKTLQRTVEQEIKNLNKDEAILKAL